jgi:hypothetical protein
MREGRGVSPSPEAEGVGSRSTAALHYKEVGRGRQLEEEDGGGTLRGRRGQGRRLEEENGGGALRGQGQGGGVL